MATKTFDQFPQSDQEDFRAVCLAADIAPETFTVTADEEYVGNGDIKGITTKVSVQFGNIVREYEAGNGTTWTIDFEDDIKAHVFV
jgi:hypothetical protein